MSASGLLDNFVIGRTYQVKVSDTGDGTYKWEIRPLGPDRISDDHYARMVADGYQHPQDTTAFYLRATLVTPPVTDDQAKEVALAWLAAVEGVDSATVDCLLMLPGRNERLGAE
ncbi:MAG TPA: hypothetical protein VGX23_37025 [Actinocrinis sp.]|nr:hypothetical protein [Actinocrinis sp.]